MKINYTVPGGALSNPNNWEYIIERVIAQDELWVFTNNANDPGGLTYGGMTYKTFEAWFKRTQPDATVELSPTLFAHWFSGPIVDGEAKMMIYQCYYDEFVDGFLNTDEFRTWPVRAMFSCLINVGRSKFVAVVQSVLNTVKSELPKLKVDGLYGSNTRLRLAAMNMAINYTSVFPDHWADLYVRMVQENCNAWERYTDMLAHVMITTDPRDALQKCMGVRPDFKRWKDLHGWMERVNRYRV